MIERELVATLVATITEKMIPLEGKIDPIPPLR
jgi:hypothetical protein